MNKESGIFNFYFLDGDVLTIKAESCKHYSGHAALTNAMITYTTLDQFKYAVNKKIVYSRFNVALYGLRVMIPSIGEKE